jgi:hypothetical protein
MATGWAASPAAQGAGEGVCRPLGAMAAPWNRSRLVAGAGGWGLGRHGAARTRVCRRRRSRRRLARRPRPRTPPDRVPAARRAPSGRRQRAGARGRRSGGRGQGGGGGAEVGVEGQGGEGGGGGLNVLLPLPPWGLHFLRPALPSPPKTNAVLHEPDGGRYRWGLLASVSLEGRAGRGQPRACWGSEATEGPPRRSPARAGAGGRRWGAKGSANGAGRRGPKVQCWRARAGGPAGVWPGRSGRAPRALPRRARGPS